MNEVLVIFPDGPIILSDHFGPVPLLSVADTCKLLRSSRESSRDFTLLILN